MKDYIDKQFLKHFNSKNIGVISLFFVIFIFLIQIFRRFVLRHGYTTVLIRSTKDFIKNNTIYVGIIGLCIATILITGAFLYFNTFEKTKNYFEKLRDTRRIKYYVIIYLALFFTVFVFLAFKKHINLKSALFDFGLEYQVIWNTSKGRLFASGVEVSNYIGDHFSPIIIFSSIIYAIFPTALTIFVIQTMCVVLGSLGIFFIAKKALKNEFFAFFWMIIFSIYYGNFGILMFDYHPVSWVIPLLIWGVYLWIYTKKYKTAFLLFVLATLCKEDVGIFVGMFGIYSLLKKDRKGLVLLIYGFLITIISMFAVIPAIRGEASDTLARYSELGTTPTEILKTLITKPKFMFDYLLTDMRISYVMKLFLPALFLFLFSPFTMLLFLPSLILNLLTNNEHQNSALYHYDTMTSIGIFIGAIFGMANILNNKKYFYKYKNIYITSILFMLICFNALFFIGNPLWNYVYMKNDRVNDYTYLTQLNGRIPKEAVISVTNAAGAHFGARKGLQLFHPTWIAYKEMPDYIIADKIDVYDSSLFSLIETRKTQGYNVLEENDSFVVLVKNTK